MKINVEALLNLIKYPLITEKTVNLQDKGKYYFIVDRSLTKYEIKSAIEKIFGTTILKVNTSIMPIKIKKVGKFSGKKSQYKKACVQLKSGESIY